MSLFLLREADAKPKLGVQIILESKICEEIGESRIGQKEQPDRIQIWQWLSQPTGELQTKDDPLDESPVDRKCLRACPMFWLSHWWRLLCGEDSFWSSWGGPVGVNRWSSHLGNESLPGGGGDPCNCVLSTTGDKSHSLLVKSGNERLDFYQDEVPYGTGESVKIWGIILDSIFFLQFSDTCTWF